MAVVDEASGVAVKGSSVTFNNTIQKDGSTYDLTGLTVKATIRAAAAPATSLGSALEDVSVTAAGTVGAVSFSLGTAATELFDVPLDPVRTALHLLQYHVIEDNFYPQMLRFEVRDAPD